MQAWKTWWRRLILTLAGVPTHHLHTKTARVKGKRNDGAELRYVSQYLKNSNSTI
jgi:hypothetical protein